MRPGSDKGVSIAIDGRLGIGQNLPLDGGVRPAVASPARVAERWWQAAILPESAGRASEGVKPFLKVTYVASALILGFWHNICIFV